MRAAIRAAASAETPARMLAPKKIAPRTAGSARRSAAWNQNARRLWIDKPAAEGVEREQRREPERRCPRSMQPEPAGDRRVDRRDLDRRRDRPDDRHERQRRRRRSRRGPRGRRRAPASRPPASARATSPPTSAPGAVAIEPTRLYQAKMLVRRVGRRDLGQRRLLDRQERPDLVARRAEDAERRGDEQHDERRCCRRRRRRPAAISSAPDDERPPPPDPVGVGRQPQADRPCRRRASASAAAPISPPSSPAAARYRTRMTPRAP